MRPYEKHIDKFPDADEVLESIDEHAELQATAKNKHLIQQILDI